MNNTNAAGHRLSATRASGCERLGIAHAVRAPRRGRPGRPVGGLVRGSQVTSDGQHTVISGLLIDQPALHGLLAKIRDMGLSLISVRRLDPDDAGHGGVV
jgi:hypothetical protein